MKVRPIFKRFDFWVGFFWDDAKRRLYFLPLPMFGVVLEFDGRMRRHGKWS